MIAACLTAVLVAAVTQIGQKVLAMFNAIQF
jgi:Flp pilus assembly pilin Flp